MARDRPTIRTTCPYCGVGCGLSVEAIGRRLKVGGDGAHPANAGRLCSKGAALGQTTGLEERLLQASIHGRTAPYEAATAAVGAAFVAAIERHGPDSVAFYVSGQLLTEDYYAANKLMKGFIGSSNIDTNSRLCMASAVVAHKIAFGADLVPGCYEDLDLADLLVFSGHNAAATHPVLFRRAEAARARGQRHVVIDPRRTDTAEGADLHLALAPQTDVRLWNGLLADLLRRGTVDRRFIDRSVDGLDAVQAELGRHDYSRAAVAADCGLSLEDLGAFFDLFAQTDKTVSLFSMGANQSASGVDKGLAILNAHLLTGRIGRAGAAPFSITGQPNAMGGRETGGMATTLAAHMDFEPAEIDRVRRFWQAPAIAQRPGLRAVELFQALGEGRIKALWIMASNPAVTLPQSDQVRAALHACPFVAVSDCSAATDTLAYAHVKLPALAWGEKNGTVTNSERRISRQRPLFAAPGDARPDWRIIADVAAAMGHGAAFGWSSPAAVFGEWARLTTFENAGARALDLGALSTLTPEAYDALAPVQWPARSAAPSLGGAEREPWPPVGTARLFADGRFFRPGGRAALTPLTACGPAFAVSPDFPLALNSGRVRDHWHTLTRTGLSADLCRHAPEPFVEIHPEDAERWGLRDGALARVQTAEGEAVMVAKVSAGQRRGALFAPMHWSDAYAPSGRVNRLTSSARDSRSGQPEFKHTPARIHLYAETWSGFALTRDPLLAQPQDEVVWRRIPQRAAQLHQFAGRGGEDQRRRLHERVTEGAGAPAVRVEDHVGGVFREAYFQDGRLDRVVFFSVGRPAPPTGWLIELFDDAIISEEARLSLLLGRPLTGGGVRAPLICTCRNVRQDALLAAVAAGALELDAVCEATGAGAGCGSCRPEIAGLLRTTAFAETRHAA